MYATNQTEYLPTLRITNTDKSSMKRNRTQGILHNIRTPNQTRLAMTSEGLEGLMDVIQDEKRRKTRKITNSGNGGVDILVVM